MALSSKRKTAADFFDGLDDPVAKDFDPEDENAHASDSDESGSAPDTEDARAHYVDVGKSKLRKRDIAPLGPQYAGSKVARDAALDAVDDYDPFSRNSEESEESDGSADFPAPKVNGHTKGRMEDVESEDDGAEDDNASSIAEDTQSSDEDMDGEEEEEDSSADGADEKDDSGQEDESSRAELRRIMAEEQKNVAATISEAAKADAGKGCAVKTQRQTFDSLLNTRIRLQKALVATNSLAALEKSREEAEKIPDEVVRGAEIAAFTLWSSLNDLRTSLDSSRAGSKRKRVSFDASTSSATLWNHMKSLETAALPDRQSTLNKWSSKSRGAEALPRTNRLNASATQTITDVLTSQLSDTSRLLKRTRTPRSCAPLQANAKVTECPDIYDDADFYGILLKELLEQRSQSQNELSALGNVDFGKTGWQAAREAKTKKVVDTRASKGRKLRYTVHEKLQNFMAPEDRGTWVERQAEELFGSLFGRRMNLGEEKRVAENEPGDEDLGDASGLLFGS